MSQNRCRPLKDGDLVYYDGWFGVVSDAAASTVFKGNGCDEKLSEADFASLHAIAPNSFLELIQAWQLKHDPSVVIRRKSSQTGDDQ